MLRNTQTDPTWVGKTYLACALVHKACLMGYSSTYCRLQNLLREIITARADKQSLILLEFLETRYGNKSTLVPAQVPIGHWPENIGDPTLEDAILGRLVHSTRKILLKGESTRKKYSTFMKEVKKA